MNTSELENMNSAELENMVDGFVVELICEGVWIKREGMDLQISRTPYSLITVMNKLHESGINARHNILRVQEDQIVISFSALQSANPFQQYNEGSATQRRSA